MALRPPKLVDLATFGIHVNNHGTQCCRCGNSARGFSDSIHADDLCSMCYYVPVRRDGRIVRAGRQEVQFYRPSTVWVMTPETFQSHMRVVWGGALVRQAAVQRISGVVKIDGVYYVTHGGNLYSGGVCVRQFALHLEERQLRQIYNAQQRTV